MRYKGSVGALWWVVLAAVAVLCICYVAHIALSGADALSVGLCAVPVAITALMAWVVLDNYLECPEVWQLPIPCENSPQVHGIRRCQMPGAPAQPADRRMGVAGRPMRQRGQMSGV